MPRKKNRQRFLSKGDIANLPPETKVIIDIETVGDGTTWIFPTKLSPAPDEENPCREIMLDPVVIAPTGKPARALRELMIHMAEDMPPFAGFDLHHFMDKRYEAARALEADWIRYLYGFGPRPAGPGKSATTVHSKLPLSGSKPDYAIVDDPDGEERRWFPLDGFADPYILELKKTTDADSFRKLYLQEFTPRDPAEMTPAERKAAHRETYLKHNRTRGQRHHRYDRY